MTKLKSSGPLAGVKVIEFSGLGPAPFCGMLLSDMGADVLRIDRPGHPDYKPEDVEARGRRSIVLDLKSETGHSQAKVLAAKADILIEGYRPGVMERLGLGPDELFTLKADLVYGRMTGWGQTGPLAQKAGHDLNYLALSGALHAMGSADKPAVPLNLVADFGGGALYLAMGVLAAFHHARSSGQGQVVDCAMTEGVTSMMSMIYGDFAVGNWQDKRESNVIDGAAPFYNVYQCADGLWLSVAAIEPQFYSALLDALGESFGPLAEQWNKANWPTMIEGFKDIFKTRARDEWYERFADIDLCVTPVLSLTEASTHPQHLSRESFVTVDGIQQPAPAPRFSITASDIQKGGDVSYLKILQEWSQED